ncbi:MAG: M90 family metallopeptidase [Parafilimonas sp.]
MKGFIIFLVVIPVIVFIIIRRRRPRSSNIILPDNFRTILNDHVAFYRQLNDADKISFENRITDFLSYVHIHAVNTEIDDLDKLLVASSAIIPVFNFDWHYYNLKDVLIYADTFDHDKFTVTSNERNTLGMVGTGAMQQMMILSKQALRQGFANELSKYNTGIHEFVHLLDKADGETDGIPEALLSKQYTIPWIQYMNEEIEKMKQGNSDFNIYGATNKAEFFAVAAEYFFGAPEQFKIKHPDLFELMEKIFHQQSHDEKKNNLQTVAL